MIDCKGILNCDILISSYYIVIITKQIEQTMNVKSIIITKVCI